MEAVEVSLEESLSDYVAERCQAEEVEILWLGLDASRFDVSGRASWEGDPCRAHPQLTLIWSVAGDFDRYTVRPRIEARVFSLVAPGPVARGERLVGVPGTTSLSLRGQRPWTGGEAVALVALSAGEPLTEANVAPPFDAKAGSIVKVIVRAGALEVYAEGRLLVDARAGDRVTVQLSSTGATLRGLLLPSGEVSL